MDTRAIGLDVGLAFTKWVTGAEDLHYGIWDDLDVTAGNLHEAQTRYSAKLFSAFPEGTLNILDIGGGAGETARKLIALGHNVDIVVPSTFLAERCRENAPEATVYETTFEEFDANKTYDLCLFSESFQYIPFEIAMTKARSYLKDGGHIIICDCFRRETYIPDPVLRTVGSGHRIEAFRAALPDLPVTLISEEEITTSVAPSVELEQKLFNVFGHALTRIDGELAAKRPKTRRVVHFLMRRLMNDKKRAQLDQRLNQYTRTAEAFAKNNIYLLMVFQIR
ncbi:MAG: class I SAM-dependent methyltransferase [Halocynthiibacter sp.]